jgi:hypothetical protein
MPEAAALLAATPAVAAPAVSAAQLNVSAIGVAVRPNPGYRPVGGLEPEDDRWPLVRAVAELTGTPAEHLEMLSDPGDGKDVCALALDRLGPPPAAQPLFLVRSGPLADPYVAMLSRLVETSGWAGSDVGITHLDELGGTVVFDLLDWCVQPVAGATALIAHEPLFADARVGAEPVCALGLRVGRGPGPLRVLGWGEGAPDGEAAAARHRFAGSTPCDSWLALCSALDDATIRRSDSVLIHTTGRLREGWLLLEAADPAALRVTGGAEAAGWSGETDRGRP